jgi:hypothetical protein
MMRVHLRKSSIEVRSSKAWAAARTVASIPAMACSGVVRGTILGSAKIRMNLIARTKRYGDLSLILRLTSLSPTQ